MHTTMTIEFIVVFNLIIEFVVSVPAGAFVGTDGSVGAFVDQYSASAGLGGSVGPTVQGNLYATAKRVNPTVLISEKSPSDRYSVENQSTSSSSSFSGPNQNVEESFGQNRPQTNKFFDDIFNIPISTLGAVNQYLNNRKKAGTPSMSGTASDAPSSVPADSTSIRYQGHHGKIGTNFNDIFNIPISVLNSVNRFLSG